MITETGILGMKNCYWECDFDKIELVKGILKKTSPGNRIYTPPLPSLPPSTSSCKK